MTNKAHIQSLASELSAELSAIRRHLHRHPERSYKEFATTAYIKSKLQSWGISQIQHLSETGLVALISSVQNPDKKVIALRADIDALPITEANNHDYCSVHQGIMHACGHDAHTTCLLGAAYILQQQRHEWQGTVKLIFQAGEEENPGGASILIQNGVLENPAPAAIFGLHIDTDLAAGSIGVCNGLAMASADEIYITVEGKGGHGARPHDCTDSILIAAQIIQNLQAIVSRRANPLLPSVLTIGKINSDGGATNIIPERVFMEGTFRTFDEKWRAQAKNLIVQTAELSAQAAGGQAKVFIDSSYPSVFNNETLGQKVGEYGAEYLGSEQVVKIPPRMGAEDFGYYSQKIPAFFYRLGAKIPNGTGLHTPTFDLDEKALPVGAGFMAYIALRQLAE